MDPPGAALKSPIESLTASVRLPSRPRCWFIGQHDSIRANTYGGHAAVKATRGHGSKTRSQPLSLLWTARLNIARSRFRPSSWSLIRIVQLGRIGPRRTRSRCFDRPICGPKKFGGIPPTILPAGEGNRARSSRITRTAKLRSGRVVRHGTPDRSRKRSRRSPRTRRRGRSPPAQQTASNSRSRIWLIG